MNVQIDNDNDVVRQILTFKDNLSSLNTTNIALDDVMALDQT